jgi:hypothetical protein
LRVIELISAIPDFTGLTIRAAHDPTTCEKDVKITDAARDRLAPRPMTAESNDTVNALPDPA